MCASETPDVQADAAQGPRSGAQISRVSFRKAALQAVPLRSSMSHYPWSASGSFSNGVVAMQSCFKLTTKQVVLALRR